MHRFLLFILTIFYISPSQAHITEVCTMQDVLTYFSDADADTLAIFDVDMVLVQPGDPAFHMANMKRFGAIAKQITKEVPKEKQMMFLSLMTTSSDPLLIDECTLILLDQLAQKHVPAMALTANLTGSFGQIPNMEKWRIESLSKVGIAFAKTAPFKGNILFNELPSYRGFYSSYLDGILFVNGAAASKGDAFLAFIEKTELAPSKIIFIDDREDNLKSLEEAVKKLPYPIVYHGLHYTGALNYPSKEISEQQFEARWKKLALEVRELN
jgi:hypothetical protein